MEVRHLGVFAFLVVLALSASAVTPAITDFNIIDGPWTSASGVDLNIKSTGDANRVRFCCGTGSCGGGFFDFNTWAQSTFADFNIIDGNSCSATEGTITVKVDVINKDENETVASTTDTIVYDKTAPATTSDKNYYSGNDATVTVTLTCTDKPTGVNNSGCRTTNATRYRKDNGAWAYGTSVTILDDGNHKIDFDSNDNLENREATQTIYITRDVSAPTVTIATSNSKTVRFDVNTSISDINRLTFTVDINGVRSTDFNALAKCASISSDKNYTCAYDENKINRTGDFNVAVTAKDIAGNTGYSQATQSYTDASAPSTAATPTLTVATSSVTLNWTANTESDINGYRIFRIGGTIAAYGSFDTNRDTNVGFSTSTSYADTNVLCDANYWYRIMAIDLTGNLGPVSAVSSRAHPCSGTSSGLSAPTVSSSTHTDSAKWYNNNDPALSWNAVSTATGYSYSIDVNSGTDPDTTSEGNVFSVTYSDKADGIWYFHIKATNGSSWSALTHYTIRIDTTAPGAPSSLSASAQADGSIKLSWSGSSDGNSGIEKYYIYRSTSSGFTADSHIGTSSEAEYTDSASNLTAGTTYYYKVKARDNAGNASGESNEASATAKTAVAGAITITITVPAYAKAGSITIEVSSSGGSMSDATLQVKTYGGDYATLLTGQSSSSFSAPYTIDEGDDGIATARVVAKDSSGNSYDLTKTFEVDTVKPDVNWLLPSGGRTLTGSIDINARASDKGAITISGIKQVNFYYKSGSAWSLIGSATSGSNGIYNYSWNTNNVADGNYEVRAEAEDKAGNKAETTAVKFVVYNLIPEKISAEKNISSADLNKAYIDDVISDLNSSNIILPAELELKKKWADGNLTRAKELLAANKYGEAAELSGNAVTLYSELAASIAAVKLSAAFGGMTLWIILGGVIVVIVVLGYFYYGGKGSGLGEGLGKLFSRKEEDKKPRWAYRED